MKWLHNLLKGLSLTTALFIFQACYGTPEGLEHISMSFKVMAADTGEPMEGVKVSARVKGYNGPDWTPGTLTGPDGEANVYYYRWDDEVLPPAFRFEPADDTYRVKDTVITDISPRLIEIKLVKAE
ncbi:MAG: hypothetical protein IKM93_03610 [Bacteroidales bacterium]|nr:hypothetical protein [Bacteroidales bacterium]